jgi:hypothetical protein
MKHHRESVHANAQTDIWIRAVAWLFGIPSEYSKQVPVSHWLAYSRVAAFAYFVAVPVACVAWTHVFGLLLGNDVHWSISGLLGVFVAGAILILDSQVASTLGRQSLTIMDKSMVLVRGVFAICLGTATAVAALLWCLGPQLERERADQALSASERDRQRVFLLHNLPKLERTTAEAAVAVDKAVADANTMPAIVTSLRDRGDACSSVVDQLEQARSQVLPALVGRRERLRQAHRALDTASTPESASVAGELREVETDIEEASKRIAHRAAECRRVQTQIDAEVKAHKQHAATTLGAAKKAYLAAQEAEIVARKAADWRLDELRKKSESAWGHNLAGQLAAFASLLAKNLWAVFVALGAGVVVLLTESTVTLGRLKLRGGAIDKLIELDEESFSKEVEAELALARAVRKAEQVALLDDQQAVRDIVSARLIAETALDNAETLRRRCNAFGSSDSTLKDLADDVFATARDKMRNAIQRAMRTGLAPRSSP